MASRCVVQCEDHGSFTVIALVGELWLPTVEQAELDIMARPVKHGEYLILDLAFLTFLDSVGLNLLLKVYLSAEARGGSACLSGPLALNVARVLRITNLDQRLTIHLTMKEALQTRPPPPARPPAPHPTPRDGGIETGQPAPE
ncbi:STAS domain-containing protein [Spirillospora sp. NPDC048911]|uniref:STAS domain-containing protein n=1 Tax=Spirillospora sp. NPDC048911 TaxID=3364527 RepID=UPI00371ADD9A